MISGSVLHLGVPVFDVCFVGPGRGEKGHMLGAADSVRRDARDALTMCLRYSVMAIDEVVTTRGNLSEDHWTRQVRCRDSRLIQPLAPARMRNIVQCHELGTKSPRSADVGQEPGNVELEDPIRINLVSLERLARPKGGVKSEPDRQQVRACRLDIHVLLEDPAMSPRRTQPPENEPEPELSAPDSTLQRLRSRLAAASKEELVALVERLASNSEELAVRIDYLTDPSAAAKALQRRISAIRGGKRFIGYGETRQVSAELATIAADIRTDVLPRDPEKAAALAEKLFCLDQVIFDRADDSDGRIGDELREACVLWLDTAAAVRASNTECGTDWPAILYEFYQANDYGVREPLLEQAQRLLREEELRALAARFEGDARRTMDAARACKVERHHVFSSSCAMGLVAGALRDPKLYEQSILVHSPEPNGLQANDIAEQYLACGDGAGALRWLAVPRGDNAQLERLDLLDRAYELVGDRARQIEVRTEVYRRAPGIHSSRDLEKILPIGERSAFRTRACQDARTSPYVSTAAELLFALEEPALAEQLIVERSTELHGRNYVLLTALVKTAKANGRVLAAALIWRALIDAILTRGYAKAYAHAARYLLELRAASASIEDYRGHASHESYERDLRLAHGRKASFWGRLSSTSVPD